LIDGSLTLFSSSSYIGGSQPAASGELHPRPAVALRSLRHAGPPRHPLILDGFRLRAFDASSGQVPTRHRRRWSACACTFYLVFKEPAFPLAPVWPQYLRLGNLTRVFQMLQPCQHLFAGHPDFLRSCFPEGTSYLEDNPKGD
jgi:hypothetical protein